MDYGVRKGSSFRQLKYADRLKIEDLTKAHHGVTDIARRLGVSRGTVYNELKRGEYIKRRYTDWKDIVCYSADIGQAKYESNTSTRGTGLKIDHDYALADYIEKKIKDEKYSPAAVLAEIREKQLQFSVQICVRTIYNYIEDGCVFKQLTNKDLPCKKQIKRRYRRVRPKERKRNFGKNIEERPDLSNRETFGHWEMDTVVGARGSTQSLLVLTERKTRNEIVRLLEGHSSECVVDRLNQLEREYGNRFSSIFKSITVDNGTEFSNYTGMIESFLNPGEKRTEVYYCHPYSSHERGSNENQNRLIRRFLKKGERFFDLTIQKIQEIEDWMNRYPRKILGFKTPEVLFEIEMGFL